jgi:putative Holliday junction resolvase
MEKAMEPGQPVVVTAELRARLRGKRIAALDYGRSRIGFAVCDELHIVASPRGFFQNAPSAADKVAHEILAACAREGVGAAIIGMPFRVDGAVTPLMQEIEAFIRRIRAAAPFPIYCVDEAFSTREASRAMIAADVKKRKRAAKGRADEVAAAVILRDFLRELE